jgi:hypothetical protein
MALTRDALRHRRPPGWSPALQRRGFPGRRSLRKRRALHPPCEVVLGSQYEPAEIGGLPYLDPNGNGVRSGASWAQMDPTQPPAQLVMADGANPGRAGVRGARPTTKTLTSACARGVSGRRMVD